MNIRKFIADIKNSPDYWGEMAVMDFAVMLGEEMQKQNISKSKLAEQTGVSKAYISKVLGGNKANFTLKSMAKFMFALGKKLCFFCQPIGDKITNSNYDEIYSWTTPNLQIDEQLCALKTNNFQTPSVENMSVIQNGVSSKKFFPRKEDRVAA